MNFNAVGQVRRIVAMLFNDGDAKVSANGRGDLDAAVALPMKAELVRLGGSYSAVIRGADKFITTAALPTTISPIVLWNGEPPGGKSYVMESVWFVGSVTQAAAATQVALLGQLVADTGASTQTLPPTDNVNMKPLINSRSGKSTYGGKGRAVIANVPWPAATGVTAGQIVVNDTAPVKTYICLTGGTTAGAGGPTGTGQAINDNGVIWAFISLAIADKWEGLPMAPNTGNAAAASIGLYAFADLQGAWIVPPGAVFCASAVLGTANAAASAIMGFAWNEVQLDLG